jgi:hypothetical protein
MCSGTIPGGGRGELKGEGAKSAAQTLSRRLIKRFSDDALAIEQVYLAISAEQ